MVTATAQSNCPNCGAPIHGDECPYCRAAFTRKRKGIDIYNTNGEYVATLYENGVLTANEARELMGLSLLI